MLFEMYLVVTESRAQAGEAERCTRCSMGNCFYSNWKWLAERFGKLLAAAFFNMHLNMYKVPTRMPPISRNELMFLCGHFGMCADSSNRFYKTFRDAENKLQRVSCFQF